MMGPHPQFEEDFELYLLGVLDGNDHDEMKAHLAGCAECRAKLGQASELLAKLGMAAPESEPDPAVRQRIVESLVRGGSKPAAANKVVPIRVETRTPLWAWLCAAACLVAIVAGVWLMRENSRLSAQVAELEQSRRQLEASMADMRVAAARAQAVLDVMTGPQTVEVELSPKSVHPEPHGKTFYNRSRGLLFYAANLNTVPSNRTYQLWLIPAQGSPVSAGVFNTDAQGNGQLILPSIPQGLTAKAFAVTEEPAGGVPAPTGTILLIGPAS
jgi:anti-sigma-K factor RskA